MALDQATRKKKSFKQRLISHKSKSDLKNLKISPQLAQLTDQVPIGEQWIHEIKLDGYRTFTKINGKTVKFLTRNGLDWTNKYQPLDLELKKIKVKNALIDGEIVAFNQKQHSDFSQLQKVLKHSQQEQLYYYVFDLLFLNGEDLRSRPLEIRKQFLKKLIQNCHSHKLIFSEHVRTSGKELLSKACQEDLEGIISKDRTQPYFSGRNNSWRKIRCSQRQELVIGGFTTSELGRQFGALLMGAFEKKQFRYVGKVGTGFNSESMKELSRRLKPLITATSPFQIAGPHSSSKIQWVKPKIVAEIKFKAWTSDMKLRQARFLALRDDKRAREIEIEFHSSTTPLTSPSETAKITHPNRIIYPLKKITKLDLAQYYKSVAPWILPHLKNRPLSVLRCPDQVGELCFFQKHFVNEKLTAIKEAEVENQKISFLNSTQGLLQLAQWGAVEFHTWQTHVDHLMNPDQIVFDFDPDEDLPFSQTLNAAWTLKELLGKLSLKSFAKTTGGKGLHVHVPIAPIYTWEQVKNFSNAVALQMESMNSKLYTAKMTKTKRTGKIFIDFHRNGFGASSIVPYSLRAHESPTVAMPVSWKELEKLKSPRDFDLNSTLMALAQRHSEPWPHFYSLKQKIKLFHLKSRGEVIPTPY